MNFKNIFLSFLYAISIQADSVCATDFKSYSYQCGQKKITFSPKPGGVATMGADHIRYELRQALSGSGARYTDNDGQEFWDRGHTALVTLSGKKLPECRRLDAPQLDAESPDGIQGLSWTLVKINGQEIAPTFGESVTRPRVTLRLNSSGWLGGFSGCNRYSGSYSLSNGILTIDPQIISTMMACLGRADAEQEKQYLTLLPTMTKIALNKDGELILSSTDDQIMVFKVLP